MKKHCILSIFICIVSVLMLAGCGGGNSSPAGYYSGGSQAATAEAQVMEAANLDSPGNPLRPGDWVRLTGAGFGLSQGSGYVEFNTSASQINASDYATWTDKEIVCRVPNGIRQKVGTREYIALQVIVHPDGSSFSPGSPFQTNGDTTPNPSPQPSPPSSTPSPSPSSSPSPSPSLSPTTPAPSPTVSPVPTPTPTGSPSPTPTLTPGGGGGVLTGTVTGTVIDAFTGTRIQGVTVTVGGITATTDANGTYQAAGVSAGNQAVNGTRTGYSNYNGTVNAVAGVTTQHDFPMTVIPYGGLYKAIQCYPPDLANPSGAVCVTTGDVNNDGIADLVTSHFTTVGGNGGRMCVYLGSTEGTFSYKTSIFTGGDAIGVALGHLNNGNNLDLVVTTHMGATVLTYEGNGDGSFTGPQKTINQDGGRPHTVVCDYFNGDSLMDLAWSNHANNCVYVALRTGDFNFDPPAAVGVANGPGRIYGGDMDSDNDIDIYGASPDSSAIFICKNNGSGVFTRADQGVGGRAHNVGMGDINGDGRKDLAVTGGVEGDGSGGFVKIYTQAAGGNFTLSQSLTLAGCNTQALLGDFGGPSTTSGRLDLAVVTYSGVNTDKISIFPNNGAGGFALTPASQYMTGPNAGHQVLGDFNSDGKPDIAVSNGAGKVPLPPSTLTILLGKGGAQFEAAPWYAENAGTHFPALGELNNDGKVDAATACITGTSVSIRLGNGDGTFGDSTTIPFGPLQPNTVTIGDLNGDSFADLAVSFNGNQSQIALCENNGDGTFKAPVYITLEGDNADTNQVVAGDLTGDGKRDLVVINRLSSKVYVLINQCAIGGSLAAGSFTQNPSSPYLLGNNSNPRGVALGDMNGDGCVDIVTANAESEGGSTGTISVLLNNSNNGTFTSKGKATTGTTNGRPFQVVLVDVDSDGKLDALVANRQDKSQGLAVLTGKGDGTFNSAVNYPTLEYACGITAADFNGDGKIDVATSNTYGTTDESENGKTLSLFLNKGNGTFNAPVNYFVGTAPRNLNSALLNNDPRPDIVTADYSSNSLSVLLHQ